MIEQDPRITEGPTFFQSLYAWMKRVAANINKNETNISSTTTTAAQAAPAGMVQMFAMNTPPSGWLKANGQAVSRTTYSALFTAIGTLYGVGDGSTTFNVPDLRGEFLRAWDDSRGVDPARAFGSAQGDQVKDHNHTIPVTGTSGGGTNPRFQFLANDGPVNLSTGGLAGTENRPRNVALMVCIKT